MAEAPELPVDIIYSEILPRLPSNSVCRFRSVSKQWLSFLSTQKMHLHHYSAKNPKLLLMGWHSCSISIIDPDHHDSITTVIITSIPFGARLSDLLILSSLDGLVCACLKNTWDLVIWNPLITHAAFNKLPTSKSHGFYAIGDVVGLYTESSNDYRLLHVKVRRDAIHAHVYSRRTNAWRRIPFFKKHHKISTYVWSPVTFSGGCLYFIATEWCIGGETLIVGFDVSSEKFTAIRFPADRSTSSGRDSNLGDVGNCIHLFVNREMLGGNWELEMWKMEGDEKWAKMFVFSSALPLSRHVPEYVMTNGERELVIWDGNRDVYKVDTKTRSYVRLYHGDGIWHRKLKQELYVGEVSDFMQDDGNNDSMHTHKRSDSIFNWVVRLG